MVKIILLLGILCLPSVISGLPVDPDGVLFQGDMILNKEQQEWLKKGVINEINSGDVEHSITGYNALIDPNLRWPNGIIYYSFDSTINSEQKDQVRTTLSKLQTKLSSCLQFSERNSGNGVVVGSVDEGCYSSVGYLSTLQTLNLGPGCFTTGTIEHEFLHAIGIYHTQSRSDRDSYIKIMLDNIDPDKTSNFDKYDETTISHYSLPYDYYSVMHYGATAFSSNGEITIQTLDPSKQDIIGEADGVSSGDIKLIRHMYGCDSTENLKLIGGSKPSEGNVFYKGLPVCDDTFSTESYGIKNGEVICKQLGFSGLQRFTQESYFGKVPADFSMDEIECTGTEARLDDCPHATTEDCGRHEGAGVVCIGNVRLIGGSALYEGNVFYKGKPVCDDTFTTETHGTKNGEVICRELGFDTFIRFTRESHFGSVPADFSMAEVKCFGTEARLDDCPHTTTANCDAQQGAGVVCAGSGTDNVNDCNKDVGVNYKGSNIDHKVVDGIEACMTWCKDTTECQVWSFRTYDKHCWIKKNLKTKINNEFFTSGNKLCAPVNECIKEEGVKYTGTGTGGNNIDSEVVDGIESCMSWCRDTTECQVWSFRTSNNKCWIKKALINEENKSDFISGNWLCDM